MEKNNISKLVTLTARDAEEIALLAQQLGYQNNTNALFERTQQILASSQDCIFVAKVNNRIIGWIHGFVALRVESELFVEIAGLVVDQSFRKQNIGRDLIGAVKDWANVAAIKKLKVRCNIIRKESHRFYQTIGFTLVKQQLIFEIT